MYLYRCSNSAEKIGIELCFGAFYFLDSMWPTVHGSRLFLLCCA